MKFTPAFILAAAIVVSGCAGYEPDEIAPSDNSLLEFTGQPVDDIQYSQLLEWYAYNRDLLVLRFNQQQWVALKVLEPCVADVREVRNLNLKTAISKRLGKLDQVVLDGRSCRIDEIRPLDHDAFSASREAN